MTPGTARKSGAVQDTPPDATTTKEIGSGLPSERTRRELDRFDPDRLEANGLDQAAENEGRFGRRLGLFSSKRPRRPGLMARDRWQWAVLGVVLIGATMSALDVTIVNIALPTIRREFGTGLALVEWVSMAYMIVLALALPIVGRLADIFGRSRLYNIGFGIFVVGSALCGFAPGIMTLVIARCLQAVGAALLQANSVALVTQVFRRRELGHALGAQAAVQGTAMALGPFIGAMLIAFAGWRFIFFVNVPIGIAGAIAARRILPRYHKKYRGVKIDYLGSALLTVGLMGLVLAVNEAGSTGWGSASILLQLALGVICLAAFIITERKVKFPTIDLALFRRYAIAAGNFTGLLAYYTLFSVLFLLPFYFEEVLKYSAVRTGVMLTAVPLSMAIVAPFAGRKCDRFGSRKFLVTGSLMLALGSLLFIFSPSTSRPTQLIVAMVVLGTGLGIFTPANNRATMAATPRDKLGMTGGFLNMMRSLGVILGVDISGMVFLAVGSAHVAHPAGVSESREALVFSSKPAFMAGFHMVMATLVGVALICTVFSFFRRNDSGKPEPVGAEPVGMA